MLPSCWSDASQGTLTCQQGGFCGTSHHKMFPCSQHSCYSSLGLPTQRFSMEGQVPAVQCGQKSCSLRRSFLLYSKRAFKSFLSLLGGGGGRCNLQAVFIVLLHIFRSPAATGTPGARCPFWAPAPSLAATGTGNFCVVTAGPSVIFPPVKHLIEMGGWGEGSSMRKRGALLLVPRSLQLWVPALSVLLHIHDI